MCNISWPTAATYKKFFVTVYGKKKYSRPFVNKIQDFLIPSKGLFWGNWIRFDLKTQKTKTVHHHRFGFLCEIKEAVCEVHCVVTQFHFIYSTFVLFWHLTLWLVNSSKEKENASISDTLKFPHSHRCFHEQQHITMTLNGKRVANRAICQIHI